MRNLLSYQVTSINTLLNGGKSTREITRVIGCGKTTIKIYRKSVRNELPGRKSGRLQKLTSRDKRAIARLIVNGGAKTNIELTRLITNEREVKVSSENIQRAFKDESLRAVVID